MEAKERKYTLEEYLAFEEKSEIRHEFIDGYLYAMTGGTRNHNRLVQRLGGILAKDGCEVFRENIKVLTNFDADVCYPDVLLVCGKIDGPKDFANNPLAIVEILSNSSRDYDMGSKFRKYQRVASLRHYILVEQYGIWVEHSERKSGLGWMTYQPYSNLEDSFFVEEIEISLKRIYEVVNWKEVE